MLLRLLLRKSSRNLLRAAHRRCTDTTRPPTWRNITIPAPTYTLRWACKRRLNFNLLHLLLCSAFMPAAGITCVVMRKAHTTASSTNYGCCWGHLATDGPCNNRALRCCLQAQGRPGAAPLAATGLVPATATVGSQLLNVLLSLTVLLLVGRNATAS